MSHEHEPPADAGTSALEDLALEPESPFLTRARRILGGDVRPDDYLPTTTEVEEGVARDMAGMRETIRTQFEAGRIPALFELDRSDELRQRNLWLLSAHHPEELVVSTSDEIGTIVLAVGVEDCAALMNALPYEVTRKLDYRAPDPLEGVWP